MILEMKRRVCFFFSLRLLFQSILVSKRKTDVATGFLFAFKKGREREKGEEEDDNDGL